MGAWPTSAKKPRLARRIAERALAFLHNVSKKFVGADASVRPQKIRFFENLRRIRNFQRTESRVRPYGSFAIFRDVRRGRCPHRPGGTNRFHGNPRRIRNIFMGRYGHRPLRMFEGFSCIRRSVGKPKNQPAGSGVKRSASVLMLFANASGSRPAYCTTAQRPASIGASRR